MITENQKHFIFDINCYYQLESQKEKFLSGKPIDILPELTFIALSANKNGQTVNWQAHYNDTYNRLKAYGLTDNWITQLKTKLNSYIGSGKTVDDFRMKFMTPIDLLISMLTDILKSVAPSIPKAEIAKSVIGDIFQKNYWNGPVVQQINTVRTLSNVVGFDTNFVIEFGKVFMQQR